MKKLAIIALLVATACHRTGVNTPPADGSSGIGAATPRDAVVRFLAAAKAGDLQALANVWGTSAGPINATANRDEVEKREIILLCYLKHDTSRILTEIPGENSERIFTVENTFKDLTRTANFWVTPGPDNRWFVRTFDSPSFADICATR